MLPDDAIPPAENPYAPPPVPAEPIIAEPVAAEPVPAAVVRPPRVWPVFVLFVLVLIVGQTAASMVLVAIAALQYGLPALAQNPAQVVADAMYSGAAMLSAMLVNQTVVGAAALAAALLSPIGWRDRLRWLPARISYGALTVAVVGTLAFSNAFNCLGGLGLLPESPMLEFLADWTSSLDNGSRVIALLIIGVLPGIAEELLFRGYIQTRLSQRWGRWWGVIVAAVLFGIMHLDPVHGTFACVIGMYLGYLTEHAGSIRPAMVCHAINNSTGVLLGYTGWEIAGPAANAAGLAVSIALMIAAVCWLNRKVPGKRPPITDSAAAMF